ncbi:Protein PLASTID TRANSCRIPTIONALLY ACTIVE 16 chloroplastic [Bienertia sinuspersici]
MPIQVVDVYTDPLAPSKSLDELFRTEEGKNMQKKKAAEQAQEAAEAERKLEEEVRAASLAQDAEEKADKAGASLYSLLTKTKDFSPGQLSWDQS